MKEETNGHCLDHSGQTGKLNLMIGLLGTCLAGVLFLVGLTVNIYWTIDSRVSSLDRQVFRNTDAISRIDETQMEVRKRLNKIEGVD